MQKVSEQEVYSAIKAGFSDFRTLAKISFTIFILTLVLVSGTVY